MATLIEKDIIGGVHKFKEVDYKSAPNLGRNLFLPQEAFKAKGGLSKLNLKGILSHSDQVAWQTSDAKTAPAEHADHQLIEDLRQCGDVTKAERLWLSTLLAQATTLVMRRRARPGRPEAGPWLLSLGQLPGSSNPAWEVKDEEDIEPRARVFRPVWTVKARILKWITLVDLDEWEAFAVRSISPMHQWIAFPKVGPLELYPQNGYFLMSADEEPSFLHEIASRKGWWNMPRHLLVDFSKYLGAPRVPDGMSCFEVCFRLIKHVLKCTDKVALGHMQHRMVAMQRATHGPCANEYAELEETADQLLDKDNEKQYRKDVKKHN